MPIIFTPFSVFCSPSNELNDLSSRPCRNVAIYFYLKGATLFVSCADFLRRFQGKELFYRVIRMGFDDIYVSSPGSISEKFGKDYFICTGPASMLVPVVVNPGEEWRGAQVMEHDNL